MDGATNLPPVVNSSKVLYRSTMSDILKETDNDNLNHLLAKFFVVNNNAFNVVQTLSFLEFVLAVGERMVLDIRCQVIYVFGLN